MGVTVIMYRSFEREPPIDLGFKKYSSYPTSYVYSRNKKHDFEVKVPSFCSDIGFDGLNILVES